MATQPHVQGEPLPLARRGGGFLLTAPSPQEVFVPEDASPEDKAVAETVRTFLEREVWPHISQLERKDLALLRQLLGRAGELGLLGVEVPEAYGGLGMDRTTAVIVVQELAPAGGVGVAHAAHSGLATLPLAFFGTEEQKQRYLPRLASGEWIGAYALTEPGYGSDALHARTIARPTSDGRGYLLTGEKQWITNAGIADLFVVFAQLEGHGFTAFLVEAQQPGVSTGPEYAKMGIHSSSTRPVILQEAYVPAENLLGEPGQGHRIALGVLDVSRLNLGAGAVGASRRLLEVSLNFAQTRRQFGHPILDFGLIQEKLAEMQSRIWALESVVYRTAGLIDKGRKEGFFTDEVQAASEYAAECAIAKVFGSETLDYVADEAVQIHGGYGYMQEYEVERAYRDARIQRIFEGTNEINRLTIPDMLLRRAARGHLPLAQAAQKVREDMIQFRRPAFVDDPLEGLPYRLQGAKMLLLAISGLAMERLGSRLAEEEEVLACAADMATEIYACESAYLRAMRRSSPIARDLTLLFAEGSFTRMRSSARKALCHIAQGDERRLFLTTADRLLMGDPLDEVDLRRKVALALAAREVGTG